MSSVRVHAMGFGYATPLFDNVCLHLKPGWVGVVGANGSGKTSLLKILAGLVLPARGKVVRPSGRVVFCPQSVDASWDHIRACAADEGGGAAKWRACFGLDVAGVTHVSRLSLGEQRRWQIAAAFAARPDLLLLDEPTNDLDEPAQSTLLQACKGYAGIGLVVSHDRAFLDALGAQTLRLERGQVELVPLPFSQARELWQQREKSLVERRHELTRQAAKLAQAARNQRERGQQAERDRRTSRHSKGPADSDARSILRKNKAERAGARLAREAASLHTRHQRLEAERQVLHVEKTPGRNLFADYQPSRRPHLFRVTLTELRRDERLVLEGPVSLGVGRQDRIWLRGANGAGKSTLLRRLLALCPEDASQALYLPQETTLAAGEVSAVDPLREALQACGASSRGRVLGFVAALGTDPEQLLRSAQWSPGERRKLTLALGLTQHVAALLLDEPTNHLDWPSIERLQALLAQFPGALVLATHDAALGRAVCDTTWSLEKRRLVMGSP